jgi:hypothetical protein
MLPPKDSSDSSISSLVRFFVDLKASLSMIWLTPRKYSFSYRDPASMKTPTPEKCPGNASVATRTPFGKVEIWSSSAGSYTVVSAAHWRSIWEGHTFWIESATVARFLDRKVGNILGEKDFLGIALVRVRGGAHFNILDLGGGRVVSPQTPVVHPAKYFEWLRLLPCPQKICSASAGEPVGRL